MSSTSQHLKLPFSQEDIEEAERQIQEELRKIDFYISDYTIEILAQKMRDGEFIIPSYQREFTWEKERKSRFLESVLMGLPIPFLFFWENPDGKLEVVDGSQRLRTLEEFIFDEFRITGDLDRLPKLEGFSFQNLKESRQRKFKNRPIRGIILSEQTNEASRFDLFERINTSSKIANTAEVRSGALSGKFMELVMNLAKNDLFHRLAPVPEKRAKEKEREELVSRFFAYGDGLDKYQDKVKEFIYEYTKTMNDRFEENPSLSDEYRQRFLAMLEFVEKNFPYGFRKSANAKTTPRARFEAIAIGCCLALKENPKLGDVQVDTAWATDSAFSDIVGSDGANVRKKLLGRIEFVKSRLLQYLA